MGFATGADVRKEEEQDGKKRVLAEVKKLFKPEFLNRIDEMLVFHPLGKNELAKIVDILLRGVKLRLAEKDIRLEISPAAKARLIEQGTDFKFGARPLKRAIQKLIEDEIAERLLRKSFKPGDTIYVKKVDGELDFVKKTEALKEDAADHAEASEK